jgi:hypothetical protein
MVFASRPWLGSRHCSLGMFRDRCLCQEGSLFWIEIVLMVAISVRFAHGASKLRSFLNLVQYRRGPNPRRQIARGYRMIVKNGSGQAHPSKDGVSPLQIYVVCLIHICEVA